VLQDAAVLGKTFTPSSLAAVSQMPQEALQPLLAELVRKEVLSVQADARSPERGQYGFLQDLVKRVAYETMSRRERKAKHIACAQFLGSVWSAEEDEIVEVVREAGMREGLIGARVSGGGSGGAVVVLGHTDAEPRVRAIAESLGAGLVGGSSPGAARFGIRVVHGRAD